MVSSSTYWYSGGYCSGLSICVVLSCGIPLGCDRNYFDYFWFVKLDYGLECMWKWFHMLQWTMDISYLMKWLFCKYLLRQFDIWCGFILKCLRRFLVCVADCPFFVSGSIHLSKFFTLWCLLYEIWISQHVMHFWEKKSTVFPHCWLSHKFCWLSPMLTTLFIRFWIEFKCSWASSVRSPINSSCSAFTGIVPQNDWACEDSCYLASCFSAAIGTSVWRVLQSFCTFFRQQLTLILA